MNETKSLEFVQPRLLASLSMNVAKYVTLHLKPKTFISIYDTLYCIDSYNSGQTTTLAQFLKVEMKIFHSIVV